MRLLVALIPAILLACGTASSSAPLPTATAPAVAVAETQPPPTPEPTSTAEPEPTATPEPEPTATPEPEPTPIPAAPASVRQNPQPSSQPPASTGGQPGPPPPPPPAAAPPSSVTLQAVLLAYSPRSFELAAGVPASIVMQNQDRAVLHDMSLPGRGKTEPCAGPCTSALNVTLPAGTYTLVCSVHPDMTATIVAR